MKTTTVTIGQPTSKNVCSHAGTMLPALVATQAQVANEIDAAFPALAFRRTHTPGRVVAAMATTLAFGGDDLSDITLLRPVACNGLVDHICSVATAYRRLTDLSGMKLTEVIGAVGRARRRIWKAAHWANPAHRASVHTPLIIDLDATIVQAHSPKQKAAPTWKRSFGFHPLIAMADYGADLGGEILVPLLRAGNAGANTADDHIRVLDLALHAIGGNTHADGLPFGKRLVVRSDGAGGTKTFIQHCHKQGFGFIVGLRSLPILVDVLNTISDNQRYRLPGRDDTDEEFIADITPQLRLAHRAGTLTSLNLDDYPPGMRFIARVSYPACGASPTDGDFLGRRIQLCVTNLHGHSADAIDRLYYLRGRAEQRIRDVKATGLSKLPFYDFATNQIWAVIAALAHSLTTWAGLMLGINRHTVGAYSATDNQRWWLWEPKTLRARLLSIAAKTTRSARKITLRYDGSHPHAPLLTTIITHLQRLRI
ncbi:IS1380 family transposase [Corynebacterium cystitidis]|uniref:IS1380 family transposase n=1 Tax=Corynebacterium cystitidis TaxID=35757 RepID=UPI00211E66CB|nr:IS1380 family transposase [Corynebacterium cystitidis]